jgi:hypothetical protein
VVLARVLLLVTVNRTSMKCHFHFLVQKMLPWFLTESHSRNKDDAKRTFKSETRQ